MQRSAIVRRDAAAARRDRALERFKERRGAEFAAELGEVIAELQIVISSEDPETRDPVDYAATLGTIGAAYFDLAEGKDPALLAESVRYYLEAEQILSKADAPISSAKIATDFADTLRGQAAGADLDLLEAAEYRYRRALDVFKRQGLTAQIEQTEAALITLRAELARARASSAKTVFSPSDTEVVKLADLLARHGWSARSRELSASVAGPDPDSACEGPPLQPGTRAARLHELLGFVKQYFLAESVRPSLGGQARSQEAFRQVADLDAALHRSAASDPGAAELEPRAWALARIARRLGRRAHVAIARPRWQSPDLRQDARAVFVSGACAELLPQPLIRERGIHLLIEPKQGTDPGQRYQQLRSADLGYFHLNQTPDEGRPDQDGARVRLASTCYELGIALALGQAILLGAEAGAKVPFELPHEIARLPAGGADGALLVEALEELAFSVPWAAEGFAARAGLEQTLEFARTHFTDNLQGEARVAWAMAADSGARPHEFVDRLRRFLAYCNGGTELLFPAWPAVYPAPGAARCFHAAPRRGGCEGSLELVRAACEKRGVEYSSGEETGGLSLPPAIWHEVGSASSVLADVTNLDPGVALALGMAHTLGKPCALVFCPEHDADADRPARRFPGIAADRITAYTSGDDHATLARRAAELFSGADALHESRDSRR